MIDNLLVKLDSAEVEEVEKLGAMLTSELYTMNDCKIVAVSIAAKLLGNVRFAKSQLNTIGNKEEQQ